MKILLLGSGGREHALAVKLGQSPLCTKLYIAPGNPGTITLGENLPFAVTEFEAIRSFCIQNAIEMVVVGPEEPLVKGLVEFLRQTPALKQLMIIGPGSVGAQLEGSKAFAKAFMERNGIPTAGYREFTIESFEEGRSYLSSHSLPIVLKADGLAAGKGVLICQSREEAIKGFTEMIQASK
ncbi:MAG: phosphoribosylamine--glycine ligase, partial [Chitinophagaceae bacterium]